MGHPTLGVLDFAQHTITARFAVHKTRVIKQSEVYAVDTYQNYTKLNPVTP